jgi:hypothetical protein
LNALKEEQKNKVDSDDKISPAEKKKKKDDLDDAFAKKAQKEQSKVVPVHIGPTAEEFYSLFGVGDDKGISGVDIGAVALKAIQEQQVIIDSLVQRITALELEVEKLKK